MDWLNIVPNLDVRISEGFVHVKMYIFDNLVIVGSANLTITGMRENLERIEIRDEPDYVSMSEKEFESLWSSSISLTPKLISTMERETPATTSFESISGVNIVKI